MKKLDSEKMFVNVWECQALQNRLKADMSDAWFAWVKETNADGTCRKWWYIDLNREYKNTDEVTYEVIPTYTIQELLDKLPNFIIKNGHAYQRWDNQSDIWYKTYDGKYELFYTTNWNTTDNLMKAAIATFKWCIENDYVVDKENPSKTHY